jgi:hypothetical protein
MEGIRLTSLSQFPEQLDALRLWDGSEMPSGLRRRLLRVWAHHQFLSEQIVALEAERRALLQSSEDASIEKVRQLMHLKGIGINGSWVVGDGIFWLARVDESSRGGWFSRLNADTVSKRRECASRFIGLFQHVMESSEGQRKRHFFFLSGVVSSGSRRAGCRVRVVVGAVASASGMSWR